MDSPQYFLDGMMGFLVRLSFKPYYKWIVLNTEYEDDIIYNYYYVLNLIING